MERQARRESLTELVAVRPEKAGWEAEWRICRTDDGGGRGTVKGGKLKVNFEEKEEESKHRAPGARRGGHQNEVETTNIRRKEAKEKLQRTESREMYGVEEAQSNASRTQEKGEAAEASSGPWFCICIFWAGFADVVIR